MSASAIITTNLSFGEWANRVRLNEDDDRSTRPFHPTSSKTTRKAGNDSLLQEQLGEACKPQRRNPTLTNA